jgi:hypothetical protein
MNLTVGPHPSAVYWRRRALVAAPLLAILVGLSTCLAGGSDSDAAKPRARAASEDLGPETPTPSPSTSPSATASPVPTWSPSPSAALLPPAPSPMPTPTGPLPCADRDLLLVALVEKSTYPLGAEPRLKLQVTNSSAKPCLRDVGSGQQELSVSSGATKLWSSDDCSPNRATDARTLYPGEKRTYWLTWSGRTSEKGCPETRTEVGAGSYQLTARLGTLLSKPVPFTIKK